MASHSLEELSKNYSSKQISRAKLKWFNSAKGFGFVVPEDNPVDAFLHITQLQKIGLHGLGEGAEILCIIDRREKGAIVTELIEVIFQGQIPENPIEIDEAGNGAFKVLGIVKLYSESKGFGFISPDDGLKDIFVHKTCLDSSEISELYPGQRVRISYKIADKGREATGIEIIANP